MRQALYAGDGRMVVRPQEPPPPPGPGEVQLEVAFTGICGTDLHILHGAMDHRVRLPQPIGHEMSGRVAAVGPGVRGWTAGQAATVLPLDWCGQCPACLAGLRGRCVVTALFDLTGRRAVVTGARRGIGLAMADALAAAGADIVAVSANLESSGSAVENVVRRHGRRFEGHRADFVDRAAVTDLARRLTADRPVDILVNNAGTIRRAPAAQHSDADWDHVLSVNLTSQFVLAREVGVGMLERGSGKIIFTASLLSFQGGVNVPGYTAAKSAIAGLTRALANEWSGRGVNVNAVAPGYIATDNTQALRDDPDRHRAILERIPAGRWGRPDDLAGAVVFLAAPASDYVHGTVLAVDGGWLGR